MADRLRVLRKRDTGREELEAPAKAQVDAALGAGGARPLDSSVRTALEPRFGYDFGQVRVHTTPQAADSAAALNARAYTVGSNIVFGAGAYAPGSSEGQRLIAHELAHVVQQSEGSVPASVGRDLAVSKPGDSLEYAADQMADQAVAGAPVAAPQPSAGVIQREADEEQEEEPPPEAMEEEEEPA